MEIGYRGLSVRPGVHMVLVYHGIDRAMAIVAKVLAAGLKQGEKCFFLGLPENVELLGRWLATEGIDVHEQTGGGNLELVSDRARLCAGRGFDLDGLTASLHAFIKDAVASRGKPVRIVIDPGWLAGGASRKEIHELEEGLDELFSVPDLPVLGMCMHSMEDTTSEELVSLLEMHSLAIIGENIRLNPHYAREEGACGAGQ